MMKVIPVPSATIARVERGAEGGKRETLRKTGKGRGGGDMGARGAQLSQGKEGRRESRKDRI